MASLPSWTSFVRGTLRREPRRRIRPEGSFSQTPNFTEQSLLLHWQSCPAGTCRAESASGLGRRFSGSFPGFLKEAGGWGRSESAAAGCPSRLSEDLRRGEPSSGIKGPKWEAENGNAQFQQSTCVTPAEGLLKGKSRRLPDAPNGPARRYAGCNFPLRKKYSIGPSPLPPLKLSSGQEPGRGHLHLGCLHNSSQELVLVGPVWVRSPREPLQEQLQMPRAKRGERTVSCVA